METSTHKYFSFQAITRACFNHSVPIFIFQPAQSPREGPGLHPVALTWWDVPIPLLLVTFMDCFCLLNRKETHTGTRVGAFPTALGGAWWPQEPGRCLHPLTLASQLRASG